MDSIILEIINSFESPSKIKASKYKDFLVYVYKTFEDKINSCKVEKIKNKYKKMRVDALKYIVANEKTIATEIFKRK
jgi:hypothetical protein